jgi:ribosome-associated protein
MKKRDTTTTPTRADRARPAIKSSHERLLEGGPRKARTKTPRPRLPLPAKTRLPAKLRLPAKARPAARAPREATAAWSVASDTARERATAIAVAALDKKAVGVEILDVAGKVDYADFLVIMTGRSDRHTQALAQGIEEALKRKGVRPMAVEGLPNGAWVLMDFGDVVVHVFLDETRQLYDIDGLWIDARRLPVPASGPPPAPSPID